MVKIGLNGLTIKGKLFLLAFVVVLGFVFVILQEEISKKHMHNLDLSIVSIEKVSKEILNLRKHEKDFLLRKDIKYKSKFENAFSKTIKNIDDLEFILKEESIDFESMKEVRAKLFLYRKEFYELIRLQEMIGLNHNSGVYKKLRVNAKALQEFAKDRSDSFAILVLTLRKHEKDFMLRNDLKYVKSFESTLKLLENSEVLNSYKNSFYVLVDYKKKLGLNEKEGLRGKARATVHKTTTLTKESLQILKKEIKEHIQSEELKNIITTSFILLVIVMLIFVISKDISKRIKSFEFSLLAFFDYLNKKRDSVELFVCDSSDELSKLGLVANENITKISDDILRDKELINKTIEVMKAYEKGDFSKSINAKSSNNTLNDLVHIINEMGENLSLNIDEILSILAEYKDSKYTKKVSYDNLDGHLRELSIGINTLSDSISSLLKESLDIGKELEGSSHELLNSVNILNKSSNETAVSLEETAASLEEIASAISSSSTNINQMYEITKSVENSSKEGENLAKKTVEAMQNITSQVSNIDEAISVIDHISFQTNILSLNAAVEAATAGEAGKGFAVVAGEVRNLASRSSDAAKEIKDIVESAIKSANDGKLISQKMIDGYEVLSENIKENALKIQEINSASKEQEEAISQINNTVTNLDRQTQENANVASQTQSIALRADEIAKDIVSDVLKKEFIGKDS